MPYARVFGFTPGSDAGRNWHVAKETSTAQFAESGQWVYTRFGFLSLYSRLATRSCFSDGARRVQVTQITEPKIGEQGSNQDRVTVESDALRACQPLCGWGMDRETL